MSIYLPLEKEFSVACKKAKAKNEELKRSMLPTGFYMLMKFYSNVMSTMFANHVYQSSGKKHTLVYSNVPCFVKDTEWFGGHKCKRFMSLIIGPSNLATSVCCTSITKRAQLTVSSDTS